MTRGFLFAEKGMFAARDGPSLGWWRLQGDSGFVRCGEGWREDRGGVGSYSEAWGGMIRRTTGALRHDA